MALPADFDDSMLKPLPYLNQVIDETLRLFAAAPSGLPRVVPPGGAELAGHWLPGGSTVTTQAYTLHRDPVVFPRPEVYDPSRWSSPTKAMKESSMHFGGGTRSKCTPLPTRYEICLPFFPNVSIVKGLMAF